MREKLSDPPVEVANVGNDVIDHLLARSADVTLLLDARIGTPIRRWYDPAHSRLDLPDTATQRVIDWVHPDDLADVLETLARTAHQGGTHTTVARIRADHDGGSDRSLMISVHDVQDTVEGGLLVQAWLIDFAQAEQAESEPMSAMSSLAAAAPVGLQVRSANGNVSFENERFTNLAAGARRLVDAHVEDGLEHAEEIIHDIVVDDRFLRLRVVPTVDDAGRLILAVASLEDVTSLQAAEAGKAAAEELFRAVFDDSPVATAILDLDGRFTQVNESLAVICGYAPDELIGRNFAEITHPDDLAVNRELLAEVLAGARRGYLMEKRYIHRAGHEVWVELTVAPVRRPNGEVGHLVAHVADITSRKTVLGAGDSAEDIAHWATHDHLTGLPNRRFLDRYLATTFGGGRRADDRFVVLFLDVDDFKPVNDQYGHLVGDEVLRTIARRLRNTCRDDEFVARYGGDEFVIVTRNLRTAQDVTLLVDRIQSAVRTPIANLVDDVIRVGASVGVGVAVDGDEPGEVLRRADDASYRAKAKGKTAPSESD